MKINLISDLHLEKGSYDFSIISSDILVLAGDICNISKKELLISFLTKIPFQQKTIFVLGNHEFSYSPYNQVIQQFRDILKNFPNIILLDNESYTINDIKFIGSTLWSDFLSNGQEFYLASKERIQKTLSESKDFIFSEKDNLNVPLIVDYLEEQSKKSLEYLEKELRHNTYKNTIVITHFPPSKKSIDKQYQSDLLNAYWANNFDFLFNYEYPPLLWLHGHVHNSNDYFINKTRVVCNPRGNLSKIMNSSFNPYLIIEI